MISILLLYVGSGEQSGSGRSKATRFSTNVPESSTNQFYSSPSSFRPRHLSFPPLMAHSRLGIRPFVPEDLNEARFTIAKSIMEPLTVANKQSVYLKVLFTFDILTAVLPRLLPSAHSCSMGCVIICVCRVHGLVAEFPILWRYSLLALPHSCLCEIGRASCRERVCR